MIQAKKAYEEEEEEDITNVEEDDVYTNLTRIENTVLNDLPLPDYNQHYNNNNNEKCSYVYPAFDDVTATTTNAPFVYDTTALSSNDTPLDYLGGPATTTSTNSYYSELGPFEGFGSVENISLDDF